MAARIIVRGLVAAAKAIRNAAKNPTVRRKAIEAAKKAQGFFSKSAQKAKQLCGKAAEKTSELWWKARGRKTLGEILKDAKAGKVSSSRQFSKPGGFNQANKDFDALTKGLPVKNQGNGIRSATLKNGSTTSVRPQSSGGKPTIEVNPPSGKVIKVRYD